MCQPDIYDICQLVLIAGKAISALPLLPYNFKLSSIKAGGDAYGGARDCFVALTCIVSLAVIKYTLNLTDMFLFQHRYLFATSCLIFLSSLSTPFFHSLNAKLEWYVTFFFLHQFSKLLNHSSFSIVNIINK